MPTGRSPERAWSERGEGGGPLIIGHRGASAIEPENSVAAFQRAITDGADGVELDVLSCATGEVVVFHDDDLARLGDSGDRIADLPLRAVQDVRLKSGAGIPTLDQVLDVCGDRLLVNVELKASGVSVSARRALVDRVARIIERTGDAVAARILVSSFDPLSVGFWRRRMPQVRAALLFERDSWLPLRRAWALPLLRPFAAHPESVLCTPRAVQRWHQRGYRVGVWTVDSAEDLQRFAAMGVHSIITNNPAQSRRLLAQP
jgi:glycerophosphoryl diester phosphodiesterase